MAHKPIAVAVLVLGLTTACSRSNQTTAMSFGAVVFSSQLSCVHVNASDIRPADFVATVDNPYFPLIPGAHYVYRSPTAEGEEITDDTVTPDTKEIRGVQTTVVHDVVELNGSKIEETFDWYAQDRDGNVWYFGEDSRQFQNGVQTGTEGSWEAGVNGARAGIIMLACPRVGNAYEQEFLAGVAEDVGRVSALSKTVTVEAGTFSDCLKTLDSSSLEKGADEYKYYAQGTGLVLEVEKKSGVRSELVSGPDD